MNDDFEKHENNGRYYNFEDNKNHGKYEEYKDNEEYEDVDEWGDDEEYEDYTENAIIGFIKRIYHGFLKNNYLYIICFYIYFTITWQFLFGGKLTGFFITVIIYAGSIALALSPAGERILRGIWLTRRLETSREKEYLLPIYEDVYEQAKEVYPTINKNIELCIVDAMYINAHALGRKTVAVTRGAMETLSEEELKGFIAHELGHIAHGDTKAELLTLIGNGIFMIPILFLKTMLNLLDITFNRKGVIGVIFAIVKYVFNVTYIAFLILIDVILAFNSRKSEFNADKFAYDVGYGSDLVEALYILHSMSMSKEASLVSRMLESHPHIAKRIGTLEDKIASTEWE